MYVPVNQVLFRYPSRPINMSAVQVLFKPSQPARKRTLNIEEDKNQCLTHFEMQQHKQLSLQNAKITFALTYLNTVLYVSGQRTGAEEAINTIKSYVGEEKGSSSTGRVQQMDAQMVAWKEEERDQAVYSLMTWRRKRNGAAWSSVPSRRCSVTDQIGAWLLYVLCCFLLGLKRRGAFLIQKPYKHVEVIRAGPEDLSLHPCSVTWSNK